MNINYTMNSVSPYGGVRVLLEIMNGLCERGHEVTLTTTEQREKLTFDFKGVYNRIHGSFSHKLNKYMRLGQAGLKKIGITPNPEIFYKHMVKKEAKETPECDINVAHDFITSRAVYASGKGVPFHHMQHFEGLMHDNPKMKDYFRQTMRKPINKIVNSIWLKKKMEEEFRYNLPLVNPAIDHSVFYPRETTQNTHEFSILSFARETRWKGFPELLEAMSIVLKKRKNIQLLAYGANEVSYQHPGVDYEFIKFPSDDELAELYSSADIVVCPSWYESFPLPPIEAMACGAPVITTRYGTEDYAEHKKNSLVVPPKNPKKLAKAIIQLIDDKTLRKKFEKRGPKTAKKFTWEKTVDKVEKIFKRKMNDEGSD